VSASKTTKQFDSHQDHIYLSRWRKLAYGASGFGEGILNDTINNALMLFYNTVLKLDATSVGWALVLPRFWDMISDPVMGHISDNTRSRWCRRRPYILAGGLLMALTFLFMWIPPTSFTKCGLFWHLLVTSFLYFTFYPVTMVPAFGLGAELSIDYHERTRLNAYWGFLNRIGGLFGGWAWPLAILLVAIRLGGFWVVAAGYAAISFACFLWTFLGTREDIELQSRPTEPFWKGMKATLRCGPLWMLAGIVLCLLTGVLVGFPAQNYIIIYYLFGGDAKAAAPIMAINTTVFATVSILGVFPMTWLGLRIGKERALFLGTVLFAAAPLLSWFVYTPTFPYLQTTFVCLVALGLLSVMVYCYAMLADLVDLDEVRTYTRREGSYSAIMSFIFKMPGTFGTLAFGILLDHFAHFDPELSVQPEQTLVRLRLILLIFPFIAFGLAAVLAFFYPIREHMIRQTRALLEARRAETQSEHP